MDNKFYVSYEAARLLKEKGYDRECIAYYQHGTFYPYAINTQRELSITNKNVAPAYMEQYSAPTKAEAIDWLDSKEVYIQIVGVGSGETQKWSYSVFDYKTCDNHASDYIFPTRLEAEEAAIIKALELL